MSNAEEETATAASRRKGLASSELARSRSLPRELPDELIRRPFGGDPRRRSRFGVLKAECWKAHRAESLLEDLLLCLAVLGVEPDLDVRAYLRAHLRVLEQPVEGTTVRAPVGAEVDEHRRMQDLLLA